MQLHYGWEMKSWNCIICGCKNKKAIVAREAMFCKKCQSTWRVRATALGVLKGIGSPLVPLPDVESDFSRRGVGLSDHMSLVGALGAKFGYTNSYYHQFPRLDLLAIPVEQQHVFDFVICSDVLEHVPPPADLALTGVYQLLKNGSFAILSVPPWAGREAPTKEFYPDLASWVEFEDRVEWIDGEGRPHVDHSPEFHGGQGQTLAFREWGMEDFCIRLLDVGFKVVQEIEPCPELGVPALDESGVFIAYS
jgi:SAM-dependent methyltransferase